MIEEPLLGGFQFAIRLFHSLLDSFAYLFDFGQFGEVIQLTLSPAYHQANFNPHLDCLFAMKFRYCEKRSTFNLRKVLFDTEMEFFRERERERERER